jgi:hypothetical protein
MSLISNLYYVNKASYIAVLVILKVLSSESKIKKGYHYIDAIVIVNFEIIFSQLL